VFTHDTINVCIEFINIFRIVLFVVLLSILNFDI